MGDELRIAYSISGHPDREQLPYAYYLTVRRPQVAAIGYTVGLTTKTSGWTYSENWSYKQPEGKLFFVQDPSKETLGQWGESLWPELDPLGAHLAWAEAAVKFEELRTDLLTFVGAVCERRNLYRRREFEERWAELRLKAVGY